MLAVSLLSLSAALILDLRRGPSVFGRSPRNPSSMGPVNRRLTDLELTEMRKVFGNTIPWSEIRIRRALFPKSFAGAALIPILGTPAKKIVFGPRFMRMMKRMGREQRAAEERRPIRLCGEGLCREIPVDTGISLPHGGVLAHELMHIRQQRRGEEMMSKYPKDEQEFQRLYDTGYWRSSGVPFPEWPHEAQANAASTYYLYVDAEDGPLHAMRKKMWGWTIPIMRRVRSGEW